MEKITVTLDRTVYRSRSEAYSKLRNSRMGKYIGLQAKLLIWNWINTEFDKAEAIWSYV